MYGTLIHSKYRGYSMDVDISQQKASYLKESVDRLTDEQTMYYLGVLEALTFAQHIYETPIIESMEYPNEQSL